VQVHGMKNLQVVFRVHEIEITHIQAMSGIVSAVQKPIWYKSYYV
jgi:hypothetical protein